MNSISHRLHAHRVQLSAFGNTIELGFANEGSACGKYGVDLFFRLKWLPQRIVATVIFACSHFTYACAELTCISAELRPSTNYTLQDDRSQCSLIAHARSVLALAEGNAALIAQFTSYELPADFVTDLEADLTAFDDATDTQADDRITSVEDTATARRLLREGRAAVVQLNAAVRNKYRRRPELIAAWKTASRVDRLDSTPTNIPVTPAA